MARLDAFGWIGERGIEERMMEDPEEKVKDWYAYGCL
jgi:hypothetical protein